MNIALTTYNRYEYLMRSFESLAACEFEGDLLNIYDDNSDGSSGTSQFLKVVDARIEDGFIHGLSIRVHLSNVHLGCDLRVYNSIKETFENTNDKFIFVLDSDGIYNRNCFTFIKNRIADLKPNENVAAISAYNSRNHPFTEDFSEELSEKSTLGGFALALNREVFEKVDPNVILPSHNSFSWDWQFNTIANEMNYKLLCAKKSYAQHIGEVGQHSTPSNMDKADDFIGR